MKTANRVVPAHQTCALVGVRAQTPTGILSAGDEAAPARAGYLLPNPVAGKDKPMMMYATPVLIFLMVLFPLYIPIGVTVVHAVRSRRSRMPASKAAPAPAPRRRLQLAAEFD